MAHVQPRLGVRGRKRRQFGASEQVESWHPAFGLDGYSLDAVVADFSLQVLQAKLRAQIDEGLLAEDQKVPCVRVFEQMLKVH